MTCSQNKITQVRSERNVFGQLVLLSIEHDLDVQLALAFPLGPIPWSLATADGMHTKTEKSKLLHNLESCSKPITNRPSDAVHIIDGNAMCKVLSPYQIHLMGWQSMFSTGYQKQNGLTLLLIHTNHAQ